MKYKKRDLTDDELLECARLKALWKSLKADRGLTQEMLASALGISQAGVSQYLNGYNALNLAIAAGFADILGIPISDFSPRLGAEADRISRASRPQPVTSWGGPSTIHRNYLVVPRLRAMPGDERNNRGEEGEPLGIPASFSRDWIRQHGWLAERLQWMDMPDRSMEPALHQGDFLLLDEGATVKDGSCYAVSYAGSVRVRRLFHTPSGGLILQADNKGHHTLTVESDQLGDIEILGRIVWRGTDQI